MQRASYLAVCRLVLAAMLASGAASADSLEASVATAMHPLRLGLGWDSALASETAEPAEPVKARPIEALEVSESIRIERRRRGSGRTLDAGVHYALAPATEFSAGIGSDASDVRLQVGIRHRLSWSAALGGLDSAAR